MTALNGEMEVKVTVKVPADLARLRSREWFRSEFETVCFAHIDDIREMLTRKPKVQK